MQHELFSSAGDSLDWEWIIAPGAEIKIARTFFDPQTALAILSDLKSSIPWRQDRIRVYGKMHDLPRLQQWFGDPGTVYVWSGLEMVPQPWPPALMQIKAKIELATSSTYNSLLANFYRDGNDTVGWHSDDEPSFGSRPTIASLSLGASRDFVLRHKHDEKMEQIKIRLTNGSLLVMAGETQANWQHALPRRLNIKEPRINLTLRSSAKTPRQR